MKKEAQRRLQWFFIVFTQRWYLFLLTWNLDWQCDFHQQKPRDYELVRKINPIFLWPFHCNISTLSINSTKHSLLTRVGNHREQNSKQGFYLVMAVLPFLSNSQLNQTPLVLPNDNSLLLTFISCRSILRVLSFSITYTLIYISIC